MASAPPFDQLAPLLRMVPGLSRPLLARLTERMIDRLDELDGDPDVETNGDELDGTGGEDDFCSHNLSWLGFPGCPVADPGGEDDVDHAAEERDMIDRDAKTEHRRRIQRTRCQPVTRECHWSGRRQIIRYELRSG